MPIVINIMFNLFYFKLNSYFTYAVSIKKIINFNLIPLKNYEDKDFYSQIDKLLNSLTEKPETQNLAKKMLLKLERK